MTRFAEAIHDLMVVPGVRGAFLALPDGRHRIYRLDLDLSAERVGALVRSLLQVLKRLGTEVSRVDLRYEQGRFAICSLAGGAVLAVVVDARPNLPLLQLSLDTLLAVGSEDRDEVLQTFQASDLLGARSREVSSAGMTPATTATPPSASAPGAVEDGDPARSAPRWSERPGAASVAPTTSSSWPTGAPARPGSGSPDELAGRGLATHGELAAALTRIAAGAARYLGRSVIANYWRQSRGSDDLVELVVVADGSIEAVAPDGLVTATLRARAQRWARAFVARCALIVADLPAELEREIDDDVLTLLGGRGDLARPVWTDDAAQ
jgi:predicted regulator of Ras-like GTPase activity (Roadblock/LC7/MglB family)